jgi:hypothetical protein
VRIHRVDAAGNADSDYRVWTTRAETHLVPGAYQLEAYSDALAFHLWPRVEVRRGALSVVRLGGFGRLRVLFIAPGGGELAGTARLWRLNAAGETVGDYALLTANRQTHLEPGAYRIQVYSDHLEKDFWQDVVIEGGATREVRVAGAQ